MALLKQIVDYPLAVGLNQATDPKLLDRGGLVAVVNGQYSKDATIDKRNGYTEVYAPNVIVPTRIVPHEDTLLGIDLRGYLVTSSDNASGWNDGTDTPQGYISNGVVTRNTLRRNNADVISNVQVAVCGDYLVRVWFESYVNSSIQYDIVETATGAVVLNGTLATSSGVTEYSTPVVVANGTKALIVYTYTQSAANGKLITHLVSCPGGGAAPTVSTAANTITDNDETDVSLFDVCALPVTATVKRWAISYLERTTLHLKVADVHENQTVATSLTIAETANFNCVYSSASYLYIGWIEQTAPPYALRFAVYQSGVITAAVLGASTVASMDNNRPIAICNDTSGDERGALLFWQDMAPIAGDAARETATVSWASITTTGAAGTLGSVDRVILHSKPWVHVSDAGNALYFWLTDLFDNGLYLYSGNGNVWTGNKFVAMAESGNVKGGSRRWPLAHVTVVANSNVFRIGTSALVQGATSLMQQADEIVVDFGSQYRWPAAWLGGTTFIGGGSVSLFDGRSPRFADFAQRPVVKIDLLHDTVDGTADGYEATAGALTAGQYSYILVYEWWDHNGDRHQSWLSDPLEYTLPADGKIFLAFATPSLSRLELAPGVAGVMALYRTESGGSTYYRVWSADDTLVAAAAGTADLVIGNNHWQYATDDTPDSAITGNEVLYTAAASGSTAGVLENQPLAGGCRYLVRHKTSLWAAGGELSTYVWYTKPKTLGTQLGWNATLAFDAGFVVTGLASMDDSLILFSEDAVYRVIGDVPDATGSNGTLQGPFLVTTDCGCIDAKSIATFSGGVIFRARRGFYLLDRGLSAHFIGHAVEDATDLAIYDRVTAATVVQSAGHIRFWMHSADILQSDTLLVYDYVQGQWATWTINPFDGGTCSPTDACVFRGSYLLQASGTYQETPGHWLDGGRFYGLQIQSAWINLGSVQGFKRLRRIEILGEGDGAHGVTVDIARDYEAALSDSYVVDEATVAALSREQFRFHVTHQKGESYQVTITETAPASLSSATAGLKSISALSFEIGAKGVLQKQPTTAHT